MDKPHIYMSWIVYTDDWICGSSYNKTNLRVCVCTTARVREVQSLHAHKCGTSSYDKAGRVYQSDSLHVLAHIKANASILTTTQLSAIIWSTRTFVLQNVLTHVDSRRLSCAAYSVCWTYFALKMDKRQLIGSATRYIAGRNAVQTVYWRKSAENSKGLVKTTRMTFFGKNEGPNKVDSAEMFARVRERYN